MVYSLKCPEEKIPENKAGGAAGVLRMDVAAAVRSLFPPWSVCLHRPAQPGFSACLKPSRREHPGVKTENRTIVLHFRD